MGISKKGDESMRKFAAVVLLSLCLFSGLRFVDDAIAGEAVLAQDVFQLSYDEIVKRYGSETITVKGIAVDVGPDRYGLPSVTLSDVPGGAHYVLCVLPYSDYIVMGDIEEGKEITMSGSPRSKTGDGILVVKNSVIVP